MRPTGRLHIGHYFGALQNWVRLQNDPSYDCLYFSADWHALTSDYADTSGVAQNVIENATDYPAVGLDPKKSILFQQSQVPEHAELHLLLSMVTPLGWLERVPTYKEALENVKDKDLHTYGFLGYPTLQTADIVIYSEEGVSLFVPVGEDQVSHIEWSREIVRRFNLYFGLIVALSEAELTRDAKSLVLIERGLDQAEGLTDRHLGSRAVSKRIDIQEMEERIRRLVAATGIQNFDQKLQQLNAEWGAGDLPRDTGIRAAFQKFVRFDETLVEPQVMLTLTPRIPGLDGRKMSKSYGNAIALSESDADIRAKTKVMVTDPARKRRTDPGNPDVCPVYDWHKLFSPPPTLEWSANGCRTAGIGCIECKSAMADNLIKWIEPVRARRLEFEKDPAKVLQVLDRGSDRAREVAQKTMTRVREAVFGWESKRKEIFGAAGE